jgi:hypothetical protein
MKRFRETKYFVTENGDVFRKWGEKYKKLKQRINEYKSVNIYTGSVASKKNMKVHRMIAECYIPNPDNKPQVNHIDGDKLNNHYTNLEWVTREENLNHAKKNGLYPRGVEHQTSKFTKKDIEYIRNNHIPKHKKYGARALSREFNVAIRTIIKIINNISYT